MMIPSNSIDIQRVLDGNPCISIESARSYEAIKWNFSKFLVDKEGNIVGRFGSLDDPSTLENDIKALL